MSSISRCCAWLALAMAPLLAQVEPRAACELLLRDGRVVAADAIVGDGDTWSLRRGETAITVAKNAVLSVHGVAVAANTLMEVHLVGGDVLRGLLVGGDSGGDQLELQAPVLGRLQVAVDRLECLLVRADLAAERELVLPDGAEEALFVKAALGLDRIAGTVHQFGEPGIRFQPEGQQEPKWYSGKDLVGLRLAGGNGPTGSFVAELCTRAGDRVGLRAFSLAGKELRAKLENGSEVALALADVACLTVMQPDVQFVGAALPVRASEAGFAGDVLYSWQKDSAVNGAPLIAGGRTYGRGLGVHSKSRLVFAVPTGAAMFLARVAFDDQALLLPVRGAVDVAVRVGDEAVFTKTAMTAGDGALTIGPLPVRPGQELTLEVDFGAGRDLGDRVDWLMPVFLGRSGASR